MHINNKLFVGMDLHKNTSSFCVKDYAGNVVRQEKVLTDRNQIRQFFNSLGQPASVVLEPVSQWYTFADLIESLGNDVHLAHPMKVKAIASARIKTDKIDAAVLADLLRSNLLPEAYFASKEIRSWKELVRFRASLINLRTQVKNKVHAILHKHALKHNFSHLFGVSGTKWLQNLTLDEPFKSNLAQYLALVDYLTKQIEETESLVEKSVTEHPQAKLLTSIPGVSFVSALTIIGEIGDIHRFPSSKKLMGYAGLVPSTYSSGDITRHGRITKTGSKWLRYIMIETAQHQLRCKRVPGFGSYYLKLKQRKGTATAAVATARKLLAVVWRLLTDNREWQPTAPDCGKSGTLVPNLSS
jgi:transposase